MAKVVICPSCQSKGSIPDESKAAPDSLPEVRRDVRRQGSIGRAAVRYGEETWCVCGTEAETGRPRPAPRLTTLTAFNRCRRSGIPVRAGPQQRASPPGARRLKAKAPVSRRCSSP